MNIQWYPGHMTKTIRMLRENISLCDIVVEILDARIPLSSKNPDIDELAKNKKRIVILNKSDLAEPSVTLLWQKYYEDKGYGVIIADSSKGKGIKEVMTVSRLLMHEKIQRQKARGRLIVPIRAMVVGIPNSGKSTFINKFAGKQIAKTGDRPGVTRSKQWIKTSGDFELLDTPGILWPKFEDKIVGLHLSFVGSVNDNVLDTETLATLLLDEMRVVSPTVLNTRYGVSEELTGEFMLEEICRKRGFLLQGDNVDKRRGSSIILDEFRAGKLGNISLERP